MDLKEFRRRGAQATNKLLTKEKRQVAAKKGWATRRKNEKNSKQTRRPRKA